MKGWGCLSWEAKKKSKDEQKEKKENKSPWGFRHATCYHSVMVWYICPHTIASNATKISAVAGTSVVLIVAMRTNALIPVMNNSLILIIYILWILDIFWFHYSNFQEILIFHLGFS